MATETEVDDVRKRFDETQHREGYTPGYKYWSFTRDDVTILMEEIKRLEELVDLWEAKS